ncbi:hypothetical protein vseg_001812 [Gypsophila vaccaria]
MGELKCTSMTLHMADRFVKHPQSILEDVPVKVVKFFIPVNFVVLDMPEDVQTPIILGRPFLCTARAVIDVGNISLTLNVGGEKASFVLTKVLKEPIVEKPCNAVGAIDSVAIEHVSLSPHGDPLEDMIFVGCARMSVDEEKKEEMVQVFSSDDVEVAFPELETVPPVSRCYSDDDAFGSEIPAVYPDPFSVDNFSYSYD